jgi:hypothetical protein
MSRLSVSLKRMDVRKIPSRKRVNGITFDSQALRRAQAATAILVHNRIVVFCSIDQVLRRSSGCR